MAGLYLYRLQLKDLLQKYAPECTNDSSMAAGSLKREDSLTAAEEEGDGIMAHPRTLVYAEAQEEAARMIEETGLLENQPYECLSPSDCQWDDQFATCSVSVTYSYEKTILIDQSEQNAFPQTAAGEASSVVETKGQVTLTSPSIVPPNRDTGVLGPAERSHSLQKNILPITKPPPLVHFYEDNDVLNPFEGSAAYPRHILLTPSPLKPIPSTRECISITTSHNKPIPRPGLPPHSNNRVTFTRFHAHEQRPIFIHLGPIHRNVFSLIDNGRGFLVEAFVWASTNSLLTRNVSEPGCTL